MKLTSFKSYSQIIFPSQGIFSLISIHILGLIYEEPRFTVDGLTEVWAFWTGLLRIFSKLKPSVIKAF